MDVAHIKKLDDSQLETFDVEYVSDRRWALVKDNIDKDFGDGAFSFLDVGGGNGLFSDRILSEYPQARCTIIDNSELLLGKNANNDRKELICESVENIEAVLSGRKFDVVFFNWLLHHLVDNTYRKTYENIVNCVSASANMLTGRGRIGIFENIYDGSLIDGLPSHLIFELTSSKIIAPLTKRLGANTAGVGVCFMSRRQWESVIYESRLHVINYSDDFKRRIPWHVKLALHLRDVRVGLFWCEENTRSS